MASKLYQKYVHKWESFAISKWSTDSRDVITDRQISEQDYMYYLHMQLCILAHPVPSTSLQSNVVCVLVRFVSPAKIAEPTEMQFGV